jgi:hypothetical protein
MKKLERIFTEDKNIEKIIKKLDRNKPFSEVMKSFEEMNNYLFKNYCMKGYLKTCEPEYCTHRITGNCDYIKSLAFLSKKYKADIINREIKK